ncbi:hypothetical protein VKT23_020048 [Stygiomarasmius scandens]|uniref:Uncharacterized protein n=1 Tax=Marasmiellus scandens TaxID=2682957 RepID=A0ABR1IJT8_9AGAR
MPGNDSSGVGLPSTTISPRHRQVRFAPDQSSAGRPSVPENNKNQLNASGKIRKPPGEVGRPGRGGYTLSKVLGWHPDQYSEVKTYINKKCSNDLDGRLPLTEQDPDLRRAVRAEARKKFPFLNDYADDWVTDDFMRGSLKYLKAALKKDDKDAELEKLRAEIETRDAGDGTGGAARGNIASTTRPLRRSGRA